jgi:hypothetical protein
MLSARSRPRYDAPCTLRTRLSTAGRRGLAEPSGRGRSPDRQPDTYSTCAEIKSIARYLPPAWQALIVDDAWGAHSPFHQDLPTEPWTPVLTCASSARTRWAPASSRDRSSTGRAALSIGPLVRLRRADYSVPAGHTGDHPRRAHPLRGSPEPSSQQYLLLPGEMRHDARRQDRAAGALTKPEAPATSTLTATIRSARPRSPGRPP